MTTAQDFKDIPHKERCAEFAWLISKAILSLHGQTAPRNPFSSKRERTGLPVEAKRSSEPDKKPIKIKEKEQQ